MRLLLGNRYGPCTFLYCFRFIAIGFVLDYRILKMHSELIKYINNSFFLAAGIYTTSLLCILGPTEFKPGPEISELSLTNIHKHTL